MTGDEHYREAERLEAAACVNGAASEAEKTRMLLRAQVHATLALAAATWHSDSTTGMEPFGGYPE